MERIELKPGDIITYPNSELALKDMESMANNNIHCILHNYHNENINTAVEIIEIGEVKKSNIKGSYQGAKMWKTVSHPYYNVPITPAPINGTNNGIPILL